MAELSLRTSSERARAFFSVPLLALGFRPFYLLASLFAVMALPFWIMSSTSGTQLGEYLRGAAWHSHEMIFGFASAVVAGFLLTAVPNWTGRATPTGAPLAGLVAMWLLARVLMLTGPANAAAIIDILFLPVLGFAIAMPIWRSRNTRNFKVLAILAGLTLANVVYHLAYSNLLPAGFTRLATTAALDVMAVLITIVGGRVIPAFIGNAVANSKPRHLASVEFASVGALLVILVAGIVKPWYPISATAWLVLFSVAAIAHGIRLLLWQPFRSFGNPLLWMLPVSYAWLPVSLALSALAQSAVVPSTAAIHALTIGSIASLMVAMIMRSSLGHTGRPLVAGPAGTSAFVLLQLTASVRVISICIAPESYREAMITSGVLWTLAFIVLLCLYWAILTQPRIDGRPG